MFNPSSRNHLRGIKNNTISFMKKLIIGAAVMATFSFTAVEVSNWGIDASHSRMGFTFNHQGIAEMQGEFKKVDVTVSASAADFSDAKIELTAQANSVYTGSDGRDERATACACRRWWHILAVRCRPERLPRSQ